MLILMSEVIDFAFIITDCHKELTVCLFSSQELVHDLLDI